MSRTVENIKYIFACIGVFMLVGFCTAQVSGAQPAHDAAAAPENIREQTVLIKVDCAELVEKIYQMHLNHSYPILRAVIYDP